MSIGSNHTLSRTISTVIGREKAAEQARLGSMAGGNAALYGYTPPKNVSIRKSEKPVQRTEARLAATRANVNLAFGELPTLDQFGGDSSRLLAAQRSDAFGRALDNRAKIDGAIENNTALARDAAGAMNVAGAQAGALAVRRRAAATGMTGGSTDLAGRKRVLGGYLTGRGNVAGAALSARTAGRNALEGERNALLGRVNRNTATDVDASVDRMNLVNQIGQAYRGIVPQAIGQEIGKAGTTVANSKLYHEQGMMGYEAFKLPSLSTGTRKTSGGLATGGAR